MNHPIRTLTRRFERSLSLSFEANGSCARPCRTGELFRLRLGDRLFALKLYDEGYFNDAYLYRALATTPVPVPAIYACDDAGEVVGKPWMLMDWVEGDQQITDLRAVGKQVGRMLREMHAIPVDGAGGRGANGWEFPDWHALVETQTRRDRAEISHLVDAETNKAFYVAIVDEFVRIGRQQPNQSFLLHGDLGLDNMIIDGNRVVALIDAGWFVGGHPLMDISYLMNSRLGEQDGILGLLEGYGVAGLNGRRDIALMRMYHWIGKLIHFSSAGQRGEYDRRRRELLECAVRHGFWPGSPAEHGAGRRSPHA
jgi:Ser/Thr protein kinase RdoA (MazF antagonist)